MGDRLFVVGSVLTEGPHEAVVSVTDANGNASNEVELSISAPTPWTTAVANLLQRFLRSDAEPLTEGEEQYLDGRGNDNGRYDVGDLRAWLRAEGKLEPLVGRSGAPAGPRR